MAKEKTEKPDWLEYSPKEIGEMAKNLANTGKGKSQIGLILRDQYGIASAKKATGKKIHEILEEQGIKEELPEDMLELIRKSVKVTGHMTANKKDYTAKRGYELTVSKIRKLAKYYKKKNMVPKNWFYSDETAKLLVK